MARRVTRRGVISATPQQRRLELATRWFIPPAAGLDQLSHPRSANKKATCDMQVAGFLNGSPGRTRTSDKVVNSHLLYQLSYRGLGARLYKMDGRRFKLVLSC